MAKWFCAQNAVTITQECLQMHGGYGFLNEYDMFHGCGAVDFHRGVIFIDGILNMEALEAEPKLDF